ncbi:MAG: hypothetical protein JWQ14_2746 [Adhaeribacter sp.]|nr:hypothetical protein [Adhaeribacter sp.]
MYLPAHQAQGVNLILPFVFVPDMLSRNKMVNNLRYFIIEKIAGNNFGFVT